MTTRSGRVSATATAARVSTAAEDPLRCEAKYRRRCDQLHQSRMKGCHKKVSGSAAYKAQAHAIGAKTRAATTTTAAQFTGSCRPRGLRRSPRRRRACMWALARRKRTSSGLRQVCG